MMRARGKHFLGGAKGARVGGLVGRRKIFGSMNGGGIVYRLLLVCYLPLVIGFVIKVGR